MIKIFANQTIIVTGAGKGIGFEICRQLALNGGNVILNDVDKILAENAAKKIRDENGNCIAFPGDASNIDFIQYMVDEAVLKFGALNIAIANAGITSYGDFMDFKLSDLNEVIKINLVGSFFLAQKAAIQIKKQKSGGSILFMSSVTGHQAHKNLAAYGMTKAGLEMLAKSLVIDLSAYQININSIAPGATMTERTVLDTNYEDAWSKITPLGRPASTYDIANAALFLVSPSSRHITGQVLIIDGGWTSVSQSPY